MLKRSDIKLSEIAPAIYLLEFPSAYLTAATMMRIQEFYECPDPKIRNNYFTLEEFMDSYANRHGAFTYTNDWAGFNIPGTVVVRFFQLFNPDLLRKERVLYQTLMPILEKHHDPFWEDMSAKYPFYILACEKDRDGYIKHELAHGMWYMFTSYRERMQWLISGWEHTKKFKACLKKAGYCAEVLDDELQAYLATSERKELKAQFDISGMRIPPSFKTEYERWAKAHSLQKVCIV